MLDAETIFRVANLLVLPGWLSLIAAPRWRWGARVIGPVAIPAVLALGYVALVAARFGRGGGGFGSLAGVATLFADPYVLLAGWIHYLAFDLFVASWEVRDAQRLSIPHWVVVPCLALTFLLGPAGLLTYLAVRSAARRALVVGD
jgi:ABA DEFICIENT 4-like